MVYFLRHRHNMGSRGTSRFPDAVVYGKLGVLRLRDVPLRASLLRSGVPPGPTEFPSRDTPVVAASSSQLDIASGLDD